MEDKEEGMRICVICKKIFPDDEGLIKHKRDQHSQLNSIDRNCSDNMSNPFRNNSLTITRVNGESIKRGTIGQGHVLSRKMPAGGGSGSASQSINIRRNEMKIIKQAELKTKVPFCSPSSGQIGLIDVGDDNTNTKWQRWVQKDSTQRDNLPVNSSDGTIITSTAAELATSAFCNSTADLTPRGKLVGKAQSVNVARKSVPHLIPMVSTNNGKRPGSTGPTNQRSGGGIRANNSTVPDIMQTLGKIKSLNQQAQVRTSPKLISLPGGASSKQVKKPVPSPSAVKHVQAPPFRMGKPPQVSKNKGKILPRNAYNNALPKPGVSQLPPQLHLEEEVDIDESYSDEELYSPPDLVRQQTIGKKSAPPSVAKATNKASNGSVGGKVPPQKTLSGNRFNPISAKKSPPPTSPSRNGSSASGLPQGTKNVSASKPTAVANGTKSFQNKQHSEPVVVAKKSSPKKTNSHEDKIRKMKLYVPNMPGTNYEMPSLTAIGSYTNKEGQQVWVCLVCNEKEQEESSRDMICCDACEDWYHWGCVGIFTSVNEDDPWYCKRCIFQASRNPRKDFPKLFKSNVPP